MRATLERVPAGTWRPVIIIGAARSGTNMLRDVLAGAAGFGTWPCDEINAIWRHGNVGWPNDELSCVHARADVKRFIRRHFERLAAVRRLSYVVEKTCANSLRVEFVNAVFPASLFIHIVRDGRDVVVSAARRWRARMDIAYTLRKARFVPVTDMPFYLVRHVRSRMHRVFSREGRVASWGPHFNGMASALTTLSLEEVCALQWLRCIERAEEGLATVNGSRVMRVRYEDLVVRPAPVCEQIFEYLGNRMSRHEVEALIGAVRSDRVGVWRNELSGQRREAVERILRAGLERLGYV